MKFHIVGTEEVLVSHSGMALAGTLLQGTKISRRLNRRTREGGPPAITDGDNVQAMIGLLCMGKAISKRSAHSKTSRTSSSVWPWA